jgi:hypothetical protein
LIRNRKLGSIYLNFDVYAERCSQESIWGSQNFHENTEMKIALVVCACALIPFTSLASAAGAPAQLYNKTVIVSFSVTFGDAVAEDGTTINRPLTSQRTLYISSKGRIFSRVDRQIGRNSQSVDRTPEDTTGHYRFEGNKLIGVNTRFISGAAQMIVSFDSGFQSCTASIGFGRDGSKPFAFKGMNGKTYTSKSSPTASTPTCSIRDGNPF